MYANDTYDEKYGQNCISALINYSVFFKAN